MNPRAQTATFNNFQRSYFPENRFENNRFENNRFEEVNERLQLQDRQQQQPQQQQALPPPRPQQEHRQAGAIPRVAVNGLNANVVERPEQQT